MMRTLPSRLVLAVTIMAVACGSASGDVTYSESFVQGDGYAPGDAQYDNWIAFRAALDTSTNTFTSLSFSGSADAEVISCTDPVVVAQLADALRTGATVTIVCDGETWNVGTCGLGIEFNVRTSGLCGCFDPGYIIRPALDSSGGNPNWGGFNTATCSAPSQTLTLTFFTATGVPAVGGWGLAAMGALLVGGLGIIVRRVL